jgi:hypothetical protein
VEEMGKKFGRKINVRKESILKEKKDNLKECERHTGDRR